MSALDVVALPPEVLNGIQPVEVIAGLHEHEYAAYHQVLDHARKVDYRTQQTAAREFEQQRRAAAPEMIRQPSGEFRTFIDMFKNAKLYQGKPVTLRGKVHKVLAHQAYENDYGITDLYDVWLYTDFSYSTEQNRASLSPTVVVCTALPKNFPRNAEVIDNVSVTGYFFRKFAYESQDNAIRLAPMVLAQRVEWQPVDESSMFRPLPPWVYATTAAVAIAIVVLLWVIGRNERQRKKERLGAAQEHSQPDFAGLETADGGSSERGTS
jgi:hypothetical protein